ncbi:MAG: molybdopterin-binding protein [Armatimonadetes bacterium]|nr:molybdopterin-binding protein [Armatimonadota bacterium]
MSACGRVVAVCVGETKGTPKRAVPEVELVAGVGVTGDAHAGAGHRQVSLLDLAAIEEMRARSLELDFGAFGENLVTEGLEVDNLGIGSELSVGAARLCVTQVGKTCHDPCAIFRAVGHCIMPDRGVFLEVLEGGVVRPGDDVNVVRHVPRATIQVAVITVSDRSYRGERPDASGPALCEYVQGVLGAHVALTAVVPDEMGAIETALKNAVDRGLDLIFTTGGTGCGPRDVTPEASRKVIERDVPGIAEHIRAQSFQRTPHALLSRAVAGIARRSLIINLPGSPAGAVESLQAVKDSLPHAVALLRGEVADCHKPAGEDLPAKGGPS